jgi:hypothetical protein
MAPGATIALEIVAGVAAMAFLAAANRIHLRIMALVNLKLPQTSRFPGPSDPEGTWTAATWRSPTTRRLYQEYRRHYPGGRLVRIYWLLVAAGFSSILLACWLFPLHRQEMSN